jgi:hypothetical protein
MEQQDIANYVRVILTEKATDILLRNDPDYYYGYAKSGWIGEKYELRVKEQVTKAERERDEAYADVEDVPRSDPRFAAAKALWEAKQTAAVQARKDLETAQRQVTQAIERRRNFRIQAITTRLFLEYLHKARLMPWPLYHPGIPHVLRQYVLTWKGQRLTPTSLVFLYLVMEESEDHADSMQTIGMDNEQYLLSNPLALSPLDIDALAFQPTRQAKEYLRELQRPAVRPVHENLDPRSNREGGTYDGIPQLGALAGEDEGKCPTCGQFTRKRIVHLRNRYFFVRACPDFATTCRFEYLSTGFDKKEDLAEHISVHEELYADA